MHGSIWVGGNMLCILLLASLFPQSMPHEYRKTFTIAAIFSRKSTVVERTLRKAELEVTQRNKLPTGTVLRTQSYQFENFSTSFYSSLVSFCDVISTGNISMVIIVDELGENTWIIPWASSILGIPVSLAYKSPKMNQNTGLKYSTAFSMIPSVADVSEAVGSILQCFGWRHLAILTGSGGDGAKATRKRLESIKSDHSRMMTKVLLHQQLNPNNLTEMDDILQSIASLDITAIFLLCEPSDVESIFNAAKKNGLLTADRVWIVTETVIEGCSTVASNCPSGLIGLRLRRSCGPGMEEESDGSLDLVHDSVMVYAEALASYLRDEKFLGIPPSSCEERALEGGAQLHKYVLDTSIQGKTGSIKFDNKGNRVEPEYEIVNLKTNKNGTMEWVPVALWVQGIVDCKGDKFEWPSAAQSPPLDMTHKRRLRVVTAHTKPFAYYSGTSETYKNGKVVCATGYACKAFSMHGNQSETTRLYCCYGLVIDLLKMLENDLGFRSDLHIVKDGKYGARDDRTGEWNGLIGELLRDEADIALADLTITDSRMGVVDFSHPFFPVGMSIMVSVRRTKHDWLVRFLKPFSWEMWLAAVLSVNTVFIVLWILDRISPLGWYYRRTVTLKAHKKFDIVASLWFTWGTIFHIDESEARPKSFSARVVTVCFAFAMTIITTSYTANLAAVLVSETEDLPVDQNGIRDIKFQNPPQDFQFATISDTSLEKVFKESKDPMYIRIWKNMRNTNVDSYHEGVEKVLSGELDAFIADKPTLLYSASQQKNCQLRLVGNTFFQSGFGLAFPKNSKWTKKISNILLLYEQLEIQQKLSEAWLSGTCGQDEPPTVSSFVAMSVEDLSGAFTIVSIGIGLALILLFVEFKVARHGFPLSRIWTNDPNWNVERTTTPTPAASSIDHVTASSTLELSFSRRRTNFLCEGEETAAYVNEFADDRLPGDDGERDVSFGDFDLNLVIQDDDSGRGSFEGPVNVQ